jgi:hypothetical protein
MYLPKVSADVVQGFENKRIFGEFSGWDGAGGEGAFRVKAVGLG